MYWWYQMLVKIWSNKNTYLLLVGMPNNVVTMKDSFLVHLTKLNAPLLHILKQSCWSRQMNINISWWLLTKLTAGIISQSCMSSYYAAPLKLTHMLYANYNLSKTEEKGHVHTKTCTWMFIKNFIYHRLKLEAIKIPFSRWINK